MIGINIWNHDGNLGQVWELMSPPQFMPAGLVRPVHIEREGFQLIENLWEEYDKLGRQMAA